MTLPKQRCGGWVRVSTSRHRSPLWKRTTPGNAWQGNGRKGHQVLSHTTLRLNLTQPIYRTMTNPSSTNFCVEWSNLAESIFSRRSRNYQRCLQFPMKAISTLSAIYSITWRNNATYELSSTQVTLWLIWRCSKLNASGRHSTVEHVKQYHQSPYASWKGCWLTHVCPLRSCRG